MAPPSGTPVYTIMADIVMAYIIMAYIIMACIDIVMAFIVLAFELWAYIVMGLHSYATPCHTMPHARTHG